MRILGVAPCAERQASRGYTLLEILVASIIGSVVVGGTFVAFVTAARIVRAQNSPAVIEATDLAQDSIARFRNNIACDSPWFKVATCTATALPAGWQNDPFPGGGAGSQSIQNTALAARRYCIRADDCDGVGGTGDCIVFRARICWNGTACPGVGTPCP